LGADEAGHDTGTRRQLEARCGHDAWARLPASSMPVAVFGGRYDGIAPPGRQQALAGRIPGATCELFEGGHLFFLQDSTAYPRIRAALSHCHTRQPPSVQAAVEAGPSDGSGQTQR